MNQTDIVKTLWFIEENESLMNIIHFFFYLSNLYMNYINSNKVICGLKWKEITGTTLYKWILTINHNTFINELMWCNFYDNCFNSIWN